MNNSNNIPEFGIKRENEERRDGGCGVIFDPTTQKYAVGKHESGRLILFGGGVNPDEDIKDGVLREITEESGLCDFLYIEKIARVLCHYRHSVKNVNRIAYATCFLVVLKSNNLMPTKLEEHEKFTLEWTTPEEMLSNWKARNEGKNHDHWIYFLKKSVNRAIELGYDKTSANFN
jgi:ADP-ribose pyrophosphatase YjhB (NUDIX family)